MVAIVAGAGAGVGISLLLVAAVMMRRRRRTRELRITSLSKAGRSSENVRENVAMPDPVSALASDGGRCRPSVESTQEVTEEMNYSETLKGEDTAASELGATIAPTSAALERAHAADARRQISAPPAASGLGRKQLVRVAAAPPAAKPPAAAAPLPPVAAAPGRNAPGLPPVLAPARPAPTAPGSSLNLTAARPAPTAPLPQ